MKELLIKLQEKMLEYNAIMAGQAEGDENLVLEQAQEIVDNNKEINGQGTEQEEEQTRGTIFDRLRQETPNA